MKLYLLTRTDLVGYDEIAGAVVSAQDELAARKLLMARCDEWTEPPSTWHDATIEFLGTAEDGEGARIILTDVRAG